MPQLTALVRPSSHSDFDRRVAERRATHKEALTRPLETNDTIAWGALVRDISTTGVGLTLCFPFHAGTYLAVDLPSPGGAFRSVLTRVVHAQDQADGTWQVGCEFVKPLSESELDLVV